MSIISKYNFAPTELSRDNLLREGKNINSIHKTRNTEIDALKTTINKNYDHEYLRWAKDSKLIIITIHRRENLGKPMKNMFRAIKRIVEEHDDIIVSYPIHMNPQIREVVLEVLGNIDRIRIIEPLDVIDFHDFQAHSYIILTNSGGV